MGQAVFRLLVITLISLILCFLVVVGVRTIGSYAHYEAPENAWFKRQFWWVYQPTLEQICNTPEVETLTPTKDWIIELPVRHGIDDWVINCAPSPIKLNEYLKASTHHDWLLDVQAHDTWGLDTFAEQTVALTGKDHFGLTSRAQKVSVFLRKKAPDWLFAADSASLLRLRLYESLYVENAFEFWPDFVIASFAIGDALQLDQRMATELHRRKKRILWAWDGKTEQAPSVPYDGIITNRPREALRKFSPSH